jgi:hypothetical protein
MDAFALNEGNVDAFIRKIMNKVIMEHYDVKAEFLNMLTACLDDQSELGDFDGDWRKRFNV